MHGLVIAFGVESVLNGNGGHKLCDSPLERSSVFFFKECIYKSVVPNQKCIERLSHKM